VPIALIVFLLVVLVICKAIAEAIN
jgi:hypothetical protein